MVAVPVAFLASIAAPCCGSARLARGPAGRGRTADAAGRPARAGGVDRRRRAGPLTIILLPSRSFRPAAGRSSKPSGPAIPVRSSWRWPRSAGELPASVRRKRSEARAFFEENFRPVRISRLGEIRRLPDRILRADRRGLALPQSGVPRSALPASARSGRGRPQARCRRAFPTRECRSDAATRRTRSCPIMIAPPSRMARSTARSSKSAGSRIRSRRSRSRSRALLA